MGARRGEDGFTLVEMLVVLALLAIVAGASGLALGAGRAGRLVAATADGLAADLARTRIDAIRAGRPRALAIDGAARRWRRENAPPVDLPHGVELDLVTAREARGLAAAGGGATIAFLPDGRSTGGRIAIRMGEARRTLVVDWLTGAVRRDPP